jgi:outer membrane protein W
VGFCLTVVMGTNCSAQENSEKEEVFKPHHQVALVISHAHVIEGVDTDGNKSALAMPSLGIDYTYVFHPKWAIGLHTDVIIEKFKVQKDLGDEQEIERSYPLAPALMGIYKPGRHWSFLLGMGAEFAKEENFLLTRAGIEYSAELTNGWEVLGSLGNDFKWNAYDTWVIGIGIAKKIGKK